MRIQPKTAAYLASTFLLILTAWTSTSAQQQGLLQSRPPITAADLRRLPSSSTPGPSNGLGIANGSSVDGVSRRRSSVGDDRRRHESARDDRSGGNSPQDAIPYWADSFNYQGLEFTYKMVGTDPKKGSKTTRIPTVIIPLIFIFPDGSVYNAATDYDGDKTVVQRIIESPIFQNYNYVIDGTSVGNTQYGDAFQRANFWDSVSTRARDYHVLLERPTVLPAQTIIVPADKDISGENPYFGGFLPRVDDAYLKEVQRSLVNQLNISPRVLPIFLWGRVTTGIGDFYYFAAEHFWAQTPNGGVPFIGTSYYPGPYLPFYHGANVEPLSHEVAEWMDDPFTNNHTPGWNYAFQGPTARCLSSPADILEVGDPLTAYPESEINLGTPGYAYHVTDAVFIDYFTRARRSRSINGQYSMFNIHHQNAAVSTAPECVGDVHLDAHFIDVPGSLGTEAFGINDRGDVVGLYADSQGNVHGFVMKDDRFHSIDFPGAIGTGAYGINDSGAIVGYFFDSQANLHGFLYKNGNFQQLDLPGAAGSYANKIDAAGDVVGNFVSGTTTHGFFFSHGTYQTFDSPFGNNTDLEAINDRGDLAGGSWDPNNEVGFVFGHSGFSALSMPDALATVINNLDNEGTKAGVMVDAYGNQDGFINLFGFFHEVNGDYDLTWDPQYLYGSNNRNQVVGITFEPTSLKTLGFIADLPLADRRNGEGDR